MDAAHPRHRLRTGLFIAIGLVVSGLAVMAYGFHLFERFELSTVDARFSFRGDLPTPRDVVVVGIDDVTFGQTGLRWPFPRDVEAKVIDRLRAAGAKVIAEDIQYTERTTPMPGCGERCVRLAAGEDAALAQSIYDADRADSKVVLSTTEVGANGTTNVLGGNAALVGARAANGNYLPDGDGVIRRFAYALQGLGTFPVVAAERFLGHPLAPSRFPDRTAWIDYVGPPGSIPFLSFSQVLRGDFAASTVRGKVVVVGATAPSLQDVHTTATSGGAEMSGPEIQATAIHTVLAGFPLRSGAAWVNLLAIVLLGVVPPFLGLRLSVVWTIVSAVFLGVVYAILAQVAFDRGTIVAAVYPLGALAVSTVGALGVHYVLSAFERHRTRDAFARFVPEQVVNEVLARSGAELRLAGTRVVGTCMFTDLRDSTRFAESLPPETVVQVMNRYLSELSAAILGHGGTLISYLGDGFMAVFGAPIEQPDHADRALAAAREMLVERLPRFNEWLRAEGHEQEFRIGVGINTGPFMAGTVGSEKRLEYTAMGDTVNSASRLEKATKEAGFYVLLADSTRAALVEPVADVVSVGGMEIRGRRDTIATWSIEAARKPAAAAARLAAV